MLPTLTIVSVGGNCDRMTFGDVSIVAPRIPPGRHQAQQLGSTRCVDLGTRPRLPRTYGDNGAETSVLASPEGSWISSVLTLVSDLCDHMTLGGGGFGVSLSGKGKVTKWQGSSSGQLDQHFQQ